MRMDFADTITSVFKCGVADHPDRIALSAPDGDLTYAQLDAAASRLASRLRALGVRPDDPVGVALPRSADLVVALLAVLEAGGGYLALDPYQPETGRATILADAGAKVVLTPELVRELSEEPAAGAPEPETSGSTAYFAYTSGSTGRPKGVCVPHRAVLRLVRGQRALPLDSGEVFAQLAPVAFDASTFEIWGPLLNGARLVVPPPGDPTPALLADLVGRQGVSVLWLTAGLFHATVEAGIGRLRGLRYLVAGGDVLSAAHADRALTELPGLTVINGYGPTENTTFTTCHRMTAPLGTDRVPIGRPIDGTTVHLLDADLNPVPDGEIGELWAAGAGLAFGYHNDPVRTARQFRPDPRVPGGRLYRTGDLAALRNGVLEFHGRVDDQVKIRGFRVEPAEIEAALRRHPEILDAAVVAQERPDGRVPVAFYLGEITLTSAELREHLAELVSQYMIPAVFHRLEELPLTANGKVDRARLATLTLPERPELSTDYRPPGTETETFLAGLWADLMQVRQVGVEDDFFELGGHSLIATRITAEIGARYGFVVSTADFYADPTVAHLATLVDEGRASR